MKVELTYFKPSGKYYSSGEYDTDPKPLFRIFEEVADKARTRNLPGLMVGHSEFIVLVEVPEHEHAYPCLVLP